MKKILLGFLVVLFLATTCHAVTMVAICKLEGGNPAWWGSVQSTDWRGSGTVAHLPDRSWGLCFITGTATQVQTIATLPTVYPIGLRNDPNGVVPLATRNKVNTWLTNNGFDTFPAGTTAIQMTKKIYRNLNGINWEQEGDNDPDDIPLQTPLKTISPIKKNIKKKK